MRENPYDLSYKPFYTPTHYAFNTESDQIEIVGYDPMDAKRRCVENGWPFCMSFDEWAAMLKLSETNYIKFVAPNGGVHVAMFRRDNPYMIGSMPFYPTTSGDFGFDRRLNKYLDLSTFQYVDSCHRNPL